ncbi:MAG: PKD domain-containing protein, partial [Bacteroidota bacterium]
MKKKIKFIFIVISYISFNGIFVFSFFFPQTLTARQVTYNTPPQKPIPGSQIVKYDANLSTPSYVRFKKGNEIEIDNFKDWARSNIGFDEKFDLRQTNGFTDKLGYTHYRYLQYYNGYPIEAAVYIAHTKNGRVHSFNGKIFREIDIDPTPSIKENTALQKALGHIGADTYKWEIEEEENHLKLILNDPSATYFPKGELVLVPQNGQFDNVDSYRLAYKFDIYAHSLLKRVYIYVDAVNGDVIFELNRICNTDVLGTAQTMYSGTRTITTDSLSSSNYRLRESGRGNGIITYDMNESTSYGSAVDFTDTDNYWNTTANYDDAAYDAHWGTEGTYDYYFYNFGRNSYDDAGAQLISYIHYDYAFSNAFWDGSAMTYGDGDGASYSPFTALDIISHELTHGVTEFSAGLIYSSESGALNESFSDIFGTAVEFYMKPGSANYLMGEDIMIGGGAIRSMENPNLYYCPDTYQGDYWDPYEEVHTNSGVQNFWFYLLLNGGSGVNDIGDSYSVAGIGINMAEQIAYRNLSVYLTPSSNYADARFYSIQAAKDLYGDCSNEVIQTTNAWYAVGIGNEYSTTLTSDFDAGISYCTAPATVEFANLSSAANGYFWNFGDGNTSTTANPVHVYSNYGIYTVSLIAYGCSGGADTTVKVDYINVDSTITCNVFMPETGTVAVQTSCYGKLFDSGGMGDYQNNTNGIITIAPPGATDVTLTFISFAFESWYDYLYIYDGPNISSTLIGAYDGYSLPNGGTITSSGGAITLYQVTDYSVTEAGFELDWSCYMSTNPPVANFTANTTTSCNGSVSFMDLSTGPTSWYWDFGDGNNSTVQNPTHTYTSDGVYTVTLIVSNAYGNDTFVQSNYITISLGGPLTALCAPGIINPLYGLGIFNVTFNTINKTTASGDDGYQDYSCTEQTNVYAGQSYSISISTSTSYEENVRVWIDYNNDAVFDTITELAFSSDDVMSNHAGTVIIPGTAALNTSLRMRVASDYAFGTPPSPCNDVMYGQVEDYAVVIMENTNPPIADFTADGTATCDGSINFTDMSVNVPSSWSWDFGDGNTSVVQDPTHVYTSNGIYTVTLTVSNAYGSDSETKTDYISVNDGPIPASCTPLTTDYWFDEGIYNVSYNTINYSSIGAEEGYMDFTCNTGTNVIIEETYSISVQTGSFSDEYVRVWIDFNNNAVFDTVTELVFSSDTIMYHTGSVTIPDGAVTNTPLRMRVASALTWFTTPTPCDDIQNGQAEDYTVIILPNTVPPVAGFDMDILEVCEGIVGFADLSTYNPTSWSWDFGDN